MKRFAAALLVGLLTIASSTYAQSWPQKPVKIIVPFPAGGATDVPARMLAERLSKIWNQPVIVENKTGAGGSIGAVEAAKSAPDGYTLFFPSGSVMTANQFIYPKAGYVAERDFRPITNLVSSPLILVVSAQSPHRTIESLIDYGLKNPGKLSFGHAGIGSQSHLANELFLQQAKFEAQGIPYKGDPPAITDLIGGSIQYSVISIGASLPHIKSGKLRALGVTSREEISQLPGIKPISAAIPDFEITGWFGMVAPAKVPQDIVTKIYESTQVALRDGTLKTQLEGTGFRVVANSPQEMGDAMNLERKKFEALVKERNLRQ